MAEILAPPPMPGWLAAQVPFERYLVDIGDGILIHVMEQGEGQPVLLFHGNPAWGYLYRKVALELAGEGYRLIMPDLVGLGFSSRTERSHFTLDNQIGWMSKLIEALDLESAVAVVQDWGGPIGLGSMARHSGLMSGLVVLNTSIGPPKPGFNPTSFHRAFSNPVLGWLASRFGLIEKNMALGQVDKESVAGIVKQSYLYPLREHGNDAVIWFVRMVPDSMDHPSVRALGEVGQFVGSYQGPAAIVWGEKDPVLGRLLNRTSRALPQAEVHATQAGHFVQEEVPAEIAAGIRSVSPLTS